MSSETTPITGPRFAAALKDLSLASLHLKTLELRNSLAHLAYSNLQLRPFAEGTQATLDTANTNISTSINDDGFQPDPDCIEAIRENELVMDRMRERILLIKAEVEFRGVSWREFDDGAVEDADEENAAAAAATTGQEQGQEGESVPSSRPLTNGVNGSADTPQDASSTTTTRTTAATTSSGSNTTRNPWTDGTFQTGTIRNGQLHMDAVPGQSVGNNSSGNGTTATGGPVGAGGRLNDEQLRRMLEDRLGSLGDDDVNDDDEGGLHL